MVTVSLSNPKNPVNTVQHWVRVTCLAYQRDVWPIKVHHFRCVSQIVEGYRTGTLSQERFPRYLSSLDLLQSEWVLDGIWDATEDEVPPWD